MKKILSVLILGLLCGCATSKINTHEGSVSDRLFPLGTYEHAVTLKVKVPQNKTYHFNGIVKISSERIEIVALSFLGTTEFRIQDDLKNNSIKVDIYRDSLKAFEPRLREYYGVLKLVMQMGSNPPKELHWKNQIIGLSIGNYDKYHVPEKIQVENSSFDLDIKVTSYKI